VSSKNLSQVDGVGDVSVGGSSLQAGARRAEPTHFSKIGIGLEDVAPRFPRERHSPKVDGEHAPHCRSTATTARHAPNTVVVVAYERLASPHESDHHDSVEDTRNSGSRARLRDVINLAAAGGTSFPRYRVRALAQLEARCPAARKMRWPWTAARDPASLPM